MNKKFIHEYIWVLGSKWGTPKLFEHIEYIFINETKMRQKIIMPWGGRVRYHKYVDYIAYVKLSSGEKILLTRSKNHKTMAKNIKEISVKLAIPLKVMTHELYINLRLFITHIGKCIGSTLCRRTIGSFAKAP
jgi:hypothetical protein